MSPRQMTVCQKHRFDNPDFCRNQKRNQNPRTPNRYTKRPLQDSVIIFSTPGMEESACDCTNHRASCKFRDSLRVGNPQIFMPFAQKILMSVISPPAILGPEMAAPILWAPGIFCSFCRKPSVPIKVLLLGGGSGFF